jgi:diguanylate cyclase (GGDEF)-like protein/PAS domain S-box-containing protein
MFRLDQSGCFKGSFHKVVWLVLVGLVVMQPVLAETIRFGVLSPRPTPEAQARWEPLGEALNAALDGREVRIQVFDIEGLDRAVSSRQVDFVLTSPGHYLLWERRYGLSAPLATRINSYGDQDLKAVGALIVARADDPSIKSLADLAGRKIAGGGRTSLSGYQMPAYEMLLAGLPPPKLEDYLETRLPHDRVVEAVLAGEADAGFLRAGRLEQMISEGLVAPDALKVINPQAMPDLPFQVSTRLYPEWPVASLPHIDAELSRDVVIELLNLHEDEALLESIGFGGFDIPASYLPVEEMMRALRVPPFNTALQPTLADVWREYRLEVTAAFMVFVLLIVMAMLLALSRGRLKRLERVIEHSPMAAYAWRNEAGWPVDFVTDNVRMLGYDAGDFLSKRILFKDLIHPDDFPRVGQELLRRIEHGPDEYQQRYRVRHGDGHWVWVQDHVWLTRARTGKVTTVHGVLLDVTERQEAEQKVLQTRHLLRYIIEHARYAVAVHDRDLNYIYVSQRYLETFGVGDQDVIGKHHYEVFPHLPQHLRDAHQRVLQGEVVSAEDDPFPQPDGSMDWTRWECRPWFEADGTIGGLIVYTEIITERKQAELELKDKTEALAQSNVRLEQLATVFTHAREGVIITDPAGAIVEVNDAFSRITGYPRDEVIGRNPSLLNSGRHGPSFFRAMWRALETSGYWSGEIWNRRKDGELYPQHLTITAVTGADGQTRQYVSLFSDVSDVKQHEQQLEYAAQYDALTGLPNRHLLSARLEEVMHQLERQGSGLALVYLDLDDFKQINDRCGHDVGDSLLKQLARRLQDALTAGDVIGRLGGDELVMALVDAADRAAIETKLEELHDLVSQPFAISEYELNISASFGVAVFPQPERIDADRLMRQADQAMYRAKLESKGGYRFFDQKEDVATRGLHESRKRIQQGLEREEFVLFYQPKVNMRTGEVTGAEALIRWQHSERGMLAPGQFLPLIEENELALVMGGWVIEQALDQIAEWNAQGLTLEVSVNVFALQLQQESFVADLQAALARHPTVRPEQFGLEVLETSALADLSKVSTIIDQCAAFGVRSALDDFGTGYSSLSYLKSLPAAVLKIDQSFVRDMLDDSNDLAILNGVLGLAGAFGRRPIAEGVETLRHGELLLDLGCDLGQGYGIARPMPAADFPSWMASWQTPDSWHQRPAKSDAQLQLIFGMIEHRSWIAAVAEYLDSSSQRRPILDRRACAFGRWLGENADKLQLTSEELQRLESLHADVHKLATALVEEQTSAEVTKEDLFRLRDQLLDYLEKLESSMPSRLAEPPV